MASRAATRNAPDWRDLMRQSLLRSGSLILSLVLFSLVAFAAVALLTYHQTDASFNTAAGGPIDNWMGTTGAWIADMMLFLAGPAGAALLPITAVQAHRLWINRPLGFWRRSVAVTVISIVLLAVAVTVFVGESAQHFPAGPGGLIGLVGARGIHGLAGLLPPAGVAWAVYTTATLLALGGTVLGWKALGLERGLLRMPPIKVSVPEALFRKPIGPTIDEDDEEAIEGLQETPRAALAAPRKEAVPDTRPPPEITEPSLRPAKAQLGPKSKQGDFFGPYDLPSVDLLDPPPTSTGPALDKIALERNARLLETVLSDFNVKGEITAVRPGPVVTRYELLPAPGIKANRVIQLADDIARNMSARSARVAAIPCRKELGIELPNQHRDAVVLHEMIGSTHFAENTGQLPVILGKNISGDPVIADLAPMPHLLIAGTTGSGKSVGLNAMILSLLYRMTPETLRLIMIDPKMLELSIYDGIPHLLSPVVTEPQKAIRALKWAVEQMEERYRMMSELKVRSLVNFNDKIRVAKAKGIPLGEEVQTGWDPVSGQPQYEKKQLDYEPMPQIVVIVDELADLMMTAGKEVEFLIQRLAQKARAAGIHLIMATQRPSVDVITGVIKANLPTRISFHVTSKIDSRTILGEQGAEQLLGKGDMLYMSGGKQVERVHGPFVSDEEVRRVADHWRSQGAPDYIQAVTEEPEDGGFALDGASLDDTPEEQMYRNACQIVFESQKASTSWLQRQLRIGYNSAARLVERMEEDGFISAPNHVGRREVFRDKDGNPL
ncbi:DNA translocase FtsK [Blastomonas aquatica]|nr:DNA translocase FtsK [Blastomonas aquatica]